MSATAVICTRDRPASLAEALGSVLRQSRPPAEVIVVDDGSDPPVEMPELTGGVELRLVRLGGEGPGAARAAGLAAAREELIAWCDDDDVWFEDHLETLAGYMESHPEVGLAYGDAEWWQDGDRAGDPFAIDYDGRILRHDNFIFPSRALCRTETARAAGGFDATLRAYEDWDLWLRMSQICRIRRVRRVLGAVRWSADGVAAGDRWAQWEAVHAAHDERLRRAGPVAEHDLDPVPRPASFDPTTWSDGRRELLWQSVMGAEHSFGVVSRHLIGALGRQGISVRMAPTRNQPPEGLAELYAPHDGRGRIGFYYDFRRRPSVLPAPLVVNYAMWESTVLPAGDASEINASVALQYVPSRRNRDTFLDCGIEVPVKVLPHGIDPGFFPILERPEREVVTFGTFSDFSPRKGIDVLVAAFLEEFDPDEPARLLLKASKAGHGFVGDDPRITWIAGMFDQFRQRERLLELLGRVDVFVLPSRGEPWGMPGLEAMATGIPLIATDWDGPADYMDPADSFPLSYELVDCEGVESNSTIYHGQWAEPDREHLRSLMRWCLEHRSEMPALGRRAAERVRRDFTWDRAAAMVRADLDALARQSRGRPRDGGSGRTPSPTRRPAHRGSSSGGGP